MYVHMVVYQNGLNLSLIELSDDAFNFNCVFRFKLWGFSKNLRHNF